MLKLTYCLVRRAELSREDFQSYWRETHAPLVRAAADALGIRRYVQSHTVATAIDAVVREGRGLDRTDYDGVAELWYDSEDALIAATQTEAGRRHGAILAEDEARFIDFARSCLFFAQENIVIGEAAPADG
ncbi:EthD domain-containing protein [Parasphingopyxis algicola]|uniref:EthD domain-containing protein n=1 Tax=Parasphingopyxis algicola TaxID=2026624 RepID=UPI0015A279E8|nr:EthD domain-containing protein [Parasphingopyxis algicola]QLC25721.1 EthD domain-containing protein [Parasphingopyxis algicola]